MTEPIRVLLVAPPWYPVPPEAYGGIERVVADLADGLVDRGHNVTLVAAPGSKTKAKLVSTFDEPRHEQIGDATVEALHWARVVQFAHDEPPEVLHDHTVIGVLAGTDLDIPHVTTVHRPPVDDYGDYLEAVKNPSGLVAISESQRNSAPHLPWVATVYNGIRTSAFPFSAQKSDDLVFVGRLTPDKAPHLAADVARMSGRRLRIVGRLAFDEEREYFEAEVRPRLNSDIEYVGELGGPEKLELVASSAAMVFPLQWDEPFGLTVVEAMACGTPVLAHPRGALPELVEDGRTGFLREDINGLVEAVDLIPQIDPHSCRSHVEQNFDVQQMVEAYEALYQKRLGLRLVS